MRLSYEIPAETYETNVMGTVNLLEACRNTPSVKSIVNVTTDKVYDNKETERPYVETDPLDGYDPYSNSKSCSELVTHSYIRSFFNAKKIAVSTMRAGNVIGGGDYAKDRLIPDCVRAALKKEKIILRNPDSVRPFQYVLEPIAAYLNLGLKQEEDFSLRGYYNIGPDEKDILRTEDLVKFFCQYWGDGADYEVHPDNGPHEAKFLMLSPLFYRVRLKDLPVTDSKEAVKLTVSWHKAENKKAITEKQIREFFARKGQEL